MFDCYTLASNKQGVMSGPVHAMELVKPKPGVTSASGIMYATSV